MNDTGEKMTAELVLRKVLRKMNSSSSFLITVAAQDYPKIEFTLLRQLSRRKNEKGIYITFNKSYTKIISSLNEKGLSSKHLYIIDAITGNKFKTNSSLNNCYCLNNPQSLTQLSISLTNLLKTNQYQFIIFDNLSAFLIYNNIETTERFVHYLIGKVQPFGIKSFFISLKDRKSRELLEVITPLFDRYVDLDKNLIH